MPIDSDDFHEIIVNRAKDAALDKAADVATEDIDKAVIKKGVGLVFAAVGLADELVEMELRHMLEATQQSEACSHIKMVDGLHGTGATADVIGLLSSYVGVAWKNSAFAKGANSPWYFHPDPEFGPKMSIGFVSYDGKPVREVTDNGRKRCSICGGINAARGDK